MSDHFKFLIIDDNADFQALLRAYISAEHPGCTIDIVEGVSTDDEIRTLIANHYDVILLDYQMEGRDGLTLLRDMRHLGMCVPTILLTAYGDEKLAVRAMREGAYDYLPKGTLTRENFVAALDDVLQSTIENTFVTAPAAHPVKFGHNIIVRGFRPMELLGKGGNASAFLAENEESGERVVLKIVSLDSVDSTDVIRFKKEYKIMSEINHPNIGRIYGQNFDETIMFMIMEYLPGGSLKEHLPHIKEKSDTELLSIIRQVAEALKCTHEAGVVHRDVKPANIMFRMDGTVVLIDYGAAKNLSDMGKLTQVGQVVGTPYYMSPEQVTGDTVLPQSDIYSLGVILYEIMTGVKPFTSSNLTNVLFSHLKAEVPQLFGERIKYQPVLEKMMAKSLIKRFKSMQEVIDAIDHYLT